MLPSATVKKKNQSLAKQVFYSLNKIIFLQKIKKN
jgi:hypothetical protein